MRGSPKVAFNVPHLSSVPNQNLGPYSLDLEPVSLQIQGCSKLPFTFLHPQHCSTATTIHSRDQMVGFQPGPRESTASARTVNRGKCPQSPHIWSWTDYHCHVDSHHLSYLMHLLLSGPLVLTWPAEKTYTLCTVLFLPCPGSLASPYLGVQDDLNQQLNECSIPVSKVSQS